MSKFKPLIVLLFSALLGCSPQLESISDGKPIPPTTVSVPLETPTPFPSAPIPPFAQLRFNDDGIVQSGAERFTLYLGGIVAVDDGELFIYGCILAGGRQRSVIFKSVDQGFTWVEVFEPIENNSILYVSFIDQNQGWLLSAWTVEVISDLKLYQTTDGGLHWKFVSNIPMGAWYGYPSRMQFFTPEFGVMDFIYAGGAPGTDKISFLSTSDGGITWTEMASLSLNSPTNRAWSGYYRSIQQPILSFDGLGNIWMLNDRRISDGFYEILVKTRESIGWQTLTLIAQEYTYQDGHVSIVQ